MGRDDHRYVLYPHYFDQAEPRPVRRVPRGSAIRAPTADEIAKAALALRLRPVLEKGRSHSSKPWDGRGRVLVEARGAKTAIVQQIGKLLREARGAGAEHERRDRT